jgi:hypothetical protein
MTVVVVDQPIMTGSAKPTLVVNKVTVMAEVVRRECVDNEATEEDAHRSSDGRHAEQWSDHACRTEAGCDQCKRCEDRTELFEHATPVRLTEREHEVSRYDKDEKQDVRGRSTPHDFRPCNATPLQQHRHKERYEHTGIDERRWHRLEPGGESCQRACNYNASDA